MVDLVSDCSEMEEDNLPCSSAAGIGAIECSVRPKRKSRGCRSEGARSKSRDIPRFLRPDCVGRLIAEYAAGYDLMASKVQLEAMRAVGQCSDRKAS